MLTARNEFTTLAELRNWLNQYTERELDAIYPHSGDYYLVMHHEVPMGDGSHVYNVDIAVKS